MEAPYVTELECKRSPITFRNRRVESEYRTYVSRRSELNVRRQLALGTLMLLGITALDFVLAAPDFAERATLLRGAFMFPPMVAAFGLTYVRRALWLRQVAGVSAALAFSITSLAISDPAHPSLAGGYFIIVVFAYFFLGLHYGIATLTGFSVAVAYVAITYLSGGDATTTIYGGYNLLVMNVICAIGAGQLELARRRDFLKERLLSFRANVDALSELANRRAFDARLADAWAAATETRGTLALMLIDIDHFKSYNDYYGHQAGDRAIHSVAQSLKRVLGRPEDFASRYGGEEFAVILVDIDRDGAMHVAEKIRESVLGERIEHKRSSAASCVTVSIGVAHLAPSESGHSERGFIQMADQALYCAKERGRNCVIGAWAADSTTTGVFSAPKMPAPESDPATRPLPQATSASPGR